jgi:hypothetical protein
MGRIIDFIMTPLISVVMPSSYTSVEGMGKVAVALAKGQWADERLIRASRMNEMMKEI